MKIYIFIIAVFSAVTIFSQSGCTDPLAINFNGSATINDGSCMYAPVTMSFQQRGLLTPAVTESSGLIYLNGVLWTHNDSGNPPYIFKVDTANASILQTVSIVNHTNVDWEDITSDDDYIYVGDFGNNDGNRIDLKVLRIRRDSIPATGTTATVNATAINFSYSDQNVFAANSSTNFDCESVISIGNWLYLFSKDRGDAQTRVYKLSKTPGTYTISPFTNYNVNGEITGADYNPQTHEVALIGYLHGKKDPFIWFLDDFTGDLFFSGNKRRIEIGSSAARWQTEGIAYLNANSLFISCETSDNPAAVYRTYKPFVTPVGIEEQTLTDENVKIYPNPVADHITIESDVRINNVELISVDGSSLYQKAFEKNKITILINDLISSEKTIFLKINSDKGTITKKLILNRN